MRAPATLAIVALLGIAGCGSDDSSSGGSPKPASTEKVAIEDFKFQPRDFEVKAGDKVDFTNRDKAKHTATSKQPGRFDSGDITTGKTKPVTFAKPGTYKYYCVYHAFMTGKVTVVK
jgi:plastocyanin